MKRLIFILMITTLCFSCKKYDDAWISSELAGVEKEIEAIEALCKDYNRNISSLKEIIEALEKNDMVKTLLYEPEKNSLTLTFRDKGVVTVKISDGENGKDIHAIPAISVRKDKDNLWYWTIDGEWCTDKDGNKVPTLNDSDVTPTIRIENDYWYVSYDKGAHWKKLFKATGEDGADGQNGDLMISGFDSDGQTVYISLNGGAELAVPMEIPLAIKIADRPGNIAPGQTFNLAFEIIGSETRPELTCIGEHGWKSKVVWTSETEGEFSITAPAELRNGKIVIFATYGEHTAVKAINFDYNVAEARVMTIVNNFYEVDGGGGVVEVKMTTNLNYSIDIPYEAKSWIKHVNTKDLREDDILLAVSPNNPGEPARSAVVKFTGNGISRSVTISQRSKVLLDSEIVLGPTDGFDNPKNGIVVLQTATKGQGTDIIIMGDGFSKRDFILDMNYKTVMEQAYEDFFSVEPYASLKEYFNVYYINAVSEDAHDAKPYYDSYGNQNGATNGSAKTCFSTTFKEGSTSVSGNNSEVQRYAKQAIRYKGGPKGTACNSESEISNRVGKALMIVMINVKCHAGTCSLSWTRNTTYDFGNAHSIAYCPLGKNGDKERRRWTLIHEAGGHGFGKLADEYEVASFTRFSTSEWIELNNLHSYGVDRNVNEYWTYEESLKWSGLTWDYTTEGSVYWAELLQSQYKYKSSEGLGIYQGGNTYSNMFCRPTTNSVMRDHSASSGKFFNAISRWAIWYRLMRLTSSTTAGNFKASLSEFIDFENKIKINTNNASNNAYGDNAVECEFLPLGKPQKQEMMWDGNELIPANYVSIETGSWIESL